MKYSRSTRCWHDLRAPGRVLARVRAWLVLLVVGLMLVACRSAESPLSTNSAPVSPPPDPLIAFPQQRPQQGERAELTAILQGDLIIEYGCLRGVSATGTSYLLIWPADVTWRRAGQQVVIQDRGGRVVAHVGSPISVSGGELPARNAAALSADLQTPFPVDCAGPFWLVGTISAP